MEEYIPRWESSFFANKEPEKAGKAFHRLLSEGLTKKGHFSLTSKSATNTNVEASFFRLDPVGSYMLRTCLRPQQQQQHADQKEENGGQVFHHHSAPFDVVLSMPPSICNIDAIQEGKYLALRRNFLEKIAQEYLQETATKTDSDVDDCDFKIFKMDIVPFRFDEEKTTLKVVMRRTVHENKKKKISLEEEREEEDSIVDVVVHLHLRPFLSTDVSQLPERFFSERGMFRRYIYYTNSILEDVLMPKYFEKFHQAFQRAQNLTRSVVCLNAWAEHVGLGPAWGTTSLSSSSSQESNTKKKGGAAENLSSVMTCQYFSTFEFSVLILKLLEEEIITTQMSEQNIIRAVLIHLAKKDVFLNRTFTIVEENNNAEGGTMMDAAAVSSLNAFSRGKNPTSVEDAAPASPTHLVGTSLPIPALFALSADLPMNTFFRHSTHFLTNIVRPLAEEALKYPSFVSDFFRQNPPKHRMWVSDVCIHVSNLSISLENCFYWKRLGGEGGEQKAAKLSSALLQQRCSKNFFIAESFREILNVALRDRVNWVHVECGASANEVEDDEEGTEEGSEDKKGAKTKNGRQQQQQKSTTENNNKTNKSSSSTVKFDVVIWMELKNEAEGRNRLIVGPAIESKERVLEFNRFWGEGMTSTRQFADGGIFRCVLLPQQRGQVLTATFVLRQILTHLISRHVVISSAANDSSSFELSFLGGNDAFLHVLEENIGFEWMDGNSSTTGLANSTRAACAAMKACFQEIMDSPVGHHLPCQLTDFNILSATERFTEIFPVREHFALLHSGDVVVDKKDNPAQMPQKQKKSNNKNNLLNNANIFAAEESADYVFPTARRMSTSSCIVPIYGVLYVEDTKGRIPNALEAIAKMRTALLAQLGKILQGKDLSSLVSPSSSSSESTITNNTLTCFVLPNSLDVCFRGFLFRVFLGHYREVSLLKAIGRHPEALTIERKLFAGAQHAKYLHPFCTGGKGGSPHHSAFVLTCRLAKRWIHAMYLSDFILPEVVELMVAYVFQSSAAVNSTSATATVTAKPKKNAHPKKKKNASRTYQDLLFVHTPKTPAHGLVLFLQLLAFFPWMEKALIFPFVDSEAAENARVHRGPEDSAILEETSGSITTSASAQSWAAQQLMFIAAPYSPMHSPFTTQTPRPMVIQRMSELAEQAYQRILGICYQLPSFKSSSTSSAFWHSIFSLDFRAFDIVFHCVPEMIPNYGHAQRQEGVPTTSIELKQLWHLDNVLAVSPLPSADPQQTEEEENEENGARKRSKKGNTTVYNNKDGMIDAKYREIFLQQKYVQQFVEFEPTLQCLKKIRGYLRNTCMCFVDISNWEYVGVVFLSKSGPQSRQQAQHLAIQVEKIVPGSFEDFFFPNFPDGATSSASHLHQTPKRKSLTADQTVPSTASVKKSNMKKKGNNKMAGGNQVQKEKEKPADSDSTPAGKVQPQGRKVAMTPNNRPKPSWPHEQGREMEKSPGVANTPTNMGSRQHQLINKQKEESVTEMLKAHIAHRKGGLLKRKRALTPTQ